LFIKKDYLFRSLREADFPKLLCYIGFRKSYLIPFTPNFDIGEGIVYKKGLKAFHKDVWTQTSEIFSEIIYLNVY